MKPKRGRNGIFEATSKWHVTTNLLKPRSKGTYGNEQETKMAGSIRNVKFFNDFETQDPFLRINIGWDFKLVRFSKEDPEKRQKWETASAEFTTKKFGSEGVEFLTGYKKRVERGIQ